MFFYLQFNVIEESQYQARLPIVATDRTTLTLKAYIPFQVVTPKSSTKSKVGTNPTMLANKAEGIPSTKLSTASYSKIKVARKSKNTQDKGFVTVAQAVVKTLTRSAVPRLAANVPSKQTIVKGESVCGKCYTFIRTRAKGNQLYVECTSCKRYLCLITGCKQFFMVEHHCINHLEEFHRLPVRQCNFNNTASRQCTCSGDHVIYHNSRNTGLCRWCERYWCLVPLCNSTYDRLLDCVNHQLAHHTVDERQMGLAKVFPSVCSKCGVMRLLAPQGTKLLKNSACYKCGVIWCHIGHCNQEFDTVEEWTNHYHKDH